MSAPASAPAATGGVPARKPRFAIFLATGCGLGFLPKAPGTWGSLGGLALATIPFVWWALERRAVGSAGLDEIFLNGGGISPYFAVQMAITAAAAAVGVWSAGRAARFWGEEDPQKVVIDEVSGQHLTIFLGCALPVAARGAAPAWETSLWNSLARDPALNWKYLLAGFILFRAFDIFKPFPVRPAERLPGGWGIMADDWAAAVYAALLLWMARALGF